MLIALAMRTTPAGAMTMCASAKNRRICIWLATRGVPCPSAFNRQGGVLELVWWVLGSGPWRPTQLPGLGQFGASQACGLALEHTAGMPAGSHRERVVAAIRISSQPLDDDQVAARSHIAPADGEPDLSGARARRDGTAPTGPRWQDRQ